MSFSHYIIILKKFLNQSFIFLQFKNLYNFKHTILGNVNLSQGWYMFIYF